MKRLSLALVAWTFFVPLSSRAAEVTRVASSFEDNHPFGMFVDLGFERTQTRMLISREAYVGGDVRYMPELRYTGVDTRLNIDAHIGLWRDLEASFGVPFVFAADETWWYSAGINDGNSTLANECLLANGGLNSGCDPASSPPRTNRAPVVDLANNGTVLRGGLGDLRFGLRYAFFDQKKDDTKPTWVMGFDYTAPTAQRLDPTAEANADQRGAVGERIHHYRLWTAFSRKMGVADPYVLAYLDLPYRGPGWYSNCDHPDPLTMSDPSHCLTGAWTRMATGIEPVRKSGVRFGSEFVIYDQKQKHQRVAFNVDLLADYVSAGRYYNEMSGLMHKLLWSDNYLKFGGAFGINALASDYISVQALASLRYQTDRYLTDEQPGAASNINPNFDYRLDMTSRRLRASEVNEFKLELVATFSI